jgi:hypothetical protein
MKRLAVLITVLSLTAPASASGKVFASSSDTDDFIASASLGRTVQTPKRLFVSAAVSPSDRGEVDWYITCERRLAFDIQFGGFVFDGQRTFRLPFPVPHPARCSVDASITFEDADPDEPYRFDRTVKIVLHGRRR